MLKILKWGAWLTFVACVLGVFACAGKMALNSRHGHGAEHGATLGWVMGAAILAGSASALVGALV